jgi:hypothetical protein
VRKQKSLAGVFCGISVARFVGFGFIIVAYPALKYWAIFNRPLRGLY